MKGCYLFAPVEPGCVGPGSGIERKVRAQHKALSQDLDCELVILPPVEYSGSILEKIVRRLPLTAAWRKWKYRGEFNDADFIYIRQVYHDASFVRWLRAIRRQNPGIRIIYEVPTYPYEQQSSRNLSGLAFRLKERANCKRAAKYFDRIVTFYGQKQIWNVCCLPLMNGFDFSSVSPGDRVLSDEIHIVSVAQNAFWHGYQFMLEGMRKYYASGGGKTVVYHMVGDVLPEHKRIVEEYQLQDHVIFHGRLSGNALYDVYGRCSLGLNVLGIPADGNPKSSSLKSREYGAMGLPVVSSIPIDYLPEDYRYLCLLPTRDEAVDMETIIRFYHEIYDGADPNAIKCEIRTFAEKKCDMTITMKPVSDWILNGDQGAMI